MTGVEILATQEIITAYAWSWLVYLCAIAIITIMAVAISFFSPGRLGTEDVIVGAIGGLIFGALLGIFPASHSVPSEYETQYKVTISDEVPMNDFLSKYEIISQEGRIYTVQSREEAYD